MVAFRLAAGRALLVVLACTFARTASTQEIEPRAYSNIPVGVNFLVAGFTNSSGGLATDPALPLQDAHLKVDTMVFGFARGLEFFGQSGKFDVGVPYAWLDGSADYAGAPVTRRVDGIGDPRLRVSINLHGAPALTLDKLPSYHQDTIVGLSVQVTAPLGQYDDTRIVNIGTNRWTFKAEFGVSKALGEDWTFEIAPSASFFSVNDDFDGGHRRAQDPVYAVQGSAIYGLRRGMWVALSGTWYTGGRTSIDDGPSRNLLRNSLLMATFGLPIDLRNSIKLYASTGLVTRIGSDTDTFGVAWQHRWGGGL
jgi:hypothetical protein